MELAKEDAAFWGPALLLVVVAVGEAMGEGWPEFLWSPSVFPLVILAGMFLYRVRIATVIFTGFIVWMIAHIVAEELGQPEFRLGPLVGALFLLAFAVPQIAYHLRHRPARPPNAARPRAPILPIRSRRPPLRDAGE